MSLLFSKLFRNDSDSVLTVVTGFAHPSLLWHHDYIPCWLSSSAPATTASLFFLEDTGLSHTWGTSSTASLLCGQLSRKLTVPPSWNYSSNDTSQSSLPWPPYLKFQNSIPYFFLVAQTIKKSTCNAGDEGSIPGSGSSPGEGKGYPLKCARLENSMARERSLVGYSPWGHKGSDMT